MWGVRGRALSHPQLPTLWAGCQALIPTGCGCGGVRAWGPVTNPTARALARCAGGMRVPGEGASCLGVGRPGSGALPPPAARPLGGLLGPITHWLWVRGGAGVGTHHQPHRARSCELALHAVGAARGRPGGAPPAWVWGVRGRALSHPRLPGLWAGCRGPLPTGCGCGGGAGLGNRLQPHNARSCVLWGRHEGTRGGRLLPGCGAPGVRHSPTPGCPPCGRAAGANYPLAAGGGGVRAWGAVTNPTARALASFMLRALYGNHPTTPSSELVAALREHVHDVNPNRLFAMVPLPHAATTEIFVRQLQVLVTPGTQILDDLVQACIWRFHTHQPAQGGVCVPQLGCVHTLIAPPTDSRLAPSTGGRERATPPPRPETLRIPPQEGLAARESGTARNRRRNLTSLAARYPGTVRAAPPPRERDPRTIAMIVLENGHYYQVRIIPHPQKSHWSLEAVDSMLPATTALPDSPISLLNDQPPDPLTGIVPGTAGTWHPGHALYCLWRWAQRRWRHTRL